jgi:hypothetical protein
MSVLEQLKLNGLELNTAAGFFALEAVDFTPPKKKPEWAQGADSDGAELVRTPLYENRTITATVRVVGTSANQALEKLGELVDMLQEAEKNPQGIPLEWTPANSTKTITFYVLTGEVTSIPIVMDGSDVGWFVAMPKVGISMTAKPFGYGAEVTGAAKANETGLSVVFLTVPSVAGDIPAEGRLIVMDTAAVGRRDVKWGLEQRYYNASTSLIEAAEAMTPVGGARSEAANTGAYSPSSAKKTIATTLVNEPTICCNTGVLKHVGYFRVKARVQVVLGSESLAENVHVRLSYQDGEGPMRANPWQTLSLGGKYVEVDLGTITTTEAVLGAQKWLGQIEAYSQNGVAKDVLHVNYLTFIPAGEGYGRARGVQSSAPGTVSAFDNFTTGTLSGSLNTRTPAVGTAWATSGAATDWTVTAGAITRNTKSDAEPRFGVLGASLGNSALALTGSVPSGGYTGTISVAGLLRWTNSSNYAFAVLLLGSSGSCEVAIGVTVAGTTTIMGSALLAAAGFFVTSLNLRITALLDGTLAVSTTTGGKPVSLEATNTALATGGALASGKPGIYDKSAGSAAVVRTITSVAASSLAGIPYCIQPSQSLEVRSDSTLTEDSTGTYGGPVPQYRGSRFFVPQDGSANRTSRIIVTADRNDLEESDQQTIADSFTAEVKLTPRYGVVPR